MNNSKSRSDLEQIARLRALRLAKETEKADLLGARRKTKPEKQKPQDRTRALLHLPARRPGATIWDDRAYDAYLHAVRRERHDRIQLIDALVVQGVSNIEAIAEKHGGSHVRDAHLAQVTHVVNGKPRTGDPDDWVHSNLETRTYTIHPEFAAAWKRLHDLTKSADS
jgi:hypothetical protein